MKSRLFFITYVVANASLILYGILALIQPEILLEPFVRNVYQFPAEAGNAMVYLSGLYRLLGYFNIIPGVLGLLILQRYWRTQQEWYMKMAIALTMLAFLGPITFDNTVGTIGFFEILEHLLFIMILVFGFLMFTGRDRRASQKGSQADLRAAPTREMKYSFNTSRTPTQNYYPDFER